VDVPPTVAEQLRSLGHFSQQCVGSRGRPHPGPSADPEDAACPADGALTAQLDRLSREVVAVVPSCTAGSITVSRRGIDVGFALPIAGADLVPRAREVLSSLALSLPAAGLGCVLVLQASAPRAFIRLAEDLASWLGSGRRPPVLDAHLAPLTASTAPTLAVALAELSLLDRAVGMLIGRGWSPEAAEAELRSRAAVTRLTVVAVAELLLASPSPAGPEGTD
jgi:hypothetical protein